LAIAEYRTERNRRQFVEDRRGPASNIRPSFLPEQGEGRVDFFSLASSPLSPSSIAAISSGVASYSAPAKVRLDFQRNFRQLLLSVLRPGRHTF
jgi:hypothetical protein